MWREISILRTIALSLPVLVWAIPGPSAAVAAEAVITDVRVGQLGEKTRFVFDLSNPVAFKVFALGDPYRVVIDLPEVGWRLPARPLPTRTGLLVNMRYGLFKPGTSRVVLDVAGPVAVGGAFLLEPSAAFGHRLVVDLLATSREAFVKQSRDLAARIADAPRAPSSPAPAAAAPRLSMASPPPRKPLRRPAALTPRKRVIAIDPGHGGIDPGTVGVSGIYEKHITLSAAREIKKQLEQTGRYKVLLTRDRDIFIRLRERVSAAREGGAELFVSIHADAIKNKNIRGLSVYTLSERASDKEAAALAEKENKADLIAGIDLNGESPEVTNILIDLAQRESMNQSARFAAGLVKSLKRETRMLRNTHRFAGFAVLKAPDVPSVLMELGFLSNRQDEKALRSKKYRAKLASALVRAVDGYFVRIEEATRK